MALVALAVGCPRPRGVLTSADRDEAGRLVQAYRDFALQPARVPPPSIEPGEQVARDGAVSGRARYVRAEEASWNRWLDGGPRLFNDRAALLFQVEIEGPPPLSWDPARTTLEVNDERVVLGAALSAEVLLGDLLYHAFLEERWGVEGDLVARTRSAGPYRSAYLPEISFDPGLTGVVAFPLVDESGPVDVHAVALRLTVPIRAGDGAHELVWVFE